MKVRIEFDTLEKGWHAKVFFDGKRQTRLRNLHLILEPHDLPVLTTNLHQSLLEVLKEGYRKVMETVNKSDD